MHEIVNLGKILKLRSRTTQALKFCIEPIDSTAQENNVFLYYPKSENLRTFITQRLQRKNLI